MSLKRFLRRSLNYFCVGALAPTLVFAHGYAGARFFPATIATDDPFVADELSLPTVSTFRQAGDPATRVTALSVDYTKRITPRFGLGFGESYQFVSPDVGPGTVGWDNLDLSAKYLVFESDIHEVLLSLGIDASVGNTGTARAGAEPTSVVSPGVFFGKGMGDLPNSLGWLRPLAVTGVISYDVPVRASVTTDGQAELNPHVLNTGLAIEYSLPYLQSQVRDLGLGAPFDQLIPLVELALSTPVDRGQGGQTTGTVSPGVLWIGRNMQVGLEAVIPVNGRTGNSVGVTFQLHWFLDDLFPHGLGAPLFGGRT
ncbi:MAG: hypothetical protein KGJ55_05680 [Gammaproteobacteria bacterium]|nr:hypothetical protein [Gammaproteobacteria bacterium]